MQNDYGYTHDPDGYLLLKITQLIELLGPVACAFGFGFSDFPRRSEDLVSSVSLWLSPLVNLLSSAPS